MSKYVLLNNHCGPSLEDKISNLSISPRNDNGGLGFVGSKLQEVDCSGNDVPALIVGYKRRQCNIIGYQHESISLVEGKYIQVKKVGQLLGKTLVGKFLG